jgi:transcriptional regulatory protein RtcR
MHDNLPVDEFVLIYHTDEQQLATLTLSDMAAISPQTRLTPYQVDYENPWDFEQVYSQLHDFTRS